MNRLLKYANITFVAASLIFSSCGKHDGEDAPDVSNIKVPYTSYAFYKDFAALDTVHIAAELNRLKSKYPQFTDFYLDTIVKFGYQGHYNDTNALMHDFLTYKDYRGLLDTVNKAYPDTKKYDDWLKKSFAYLRYYDSTFDIPQHIYYYVSGLNGMATVFQSEQNLGVGLDMFLGRDFLPYAQIGVSNYATIRMTDENIPVWVAQAIYEDKYHFNPDNNDLLGLMIQKGKEMYFVEKVTPYLSDEVRLGFTKEQLEWCKKNEAVMYNFLVQNQLLFDKNLQKTLRYVNDGPTAAGMPMESPGNIGTYLGWMIVKKYVELHPLSMHALLEITNAQEILEGAHYKP